MRPIILAFAAMWLVTTVILLGSTQPVGPHDLVRFGWTRVERQRCPAVMYQYQRAVTYRDSLHWYGPTHEDTLMRYGTWLGREWEQRYYRADAEWRRQVWDAAWGATDPQYDLMTYLHKLRQLIGPAYYQLGRMPAPVYAGD